jgi:hypothetical protein
MPNKTTAPTLPSATLSHQLDLQNREHSVATSKHFAFLIIAGLPAFGIIIAALSLALPLFACLMAGCFLFATALVCHKAIASFTGKTLRLLVTARLVIILVLASLLFLATGTMWTALISTVVLWLVAYRLMGRRALHDLWKLTRKDGNSPTN